MFSRFFVVWIGYDNLAFGSVSYPYFRAKPKDRCSCRYLEGRAASVRRGDGAALLGFVGSCYGHGDVGLLPHHAVTLPLPSGEPVPSDGIVLTRICSLVHRTLEPNAEPSLLVLC